MQKGTNLISVGSLENITGSITDAPDSLRPGPPTSNDSPMLSDRTEVNFEFRSYRPASSVFGSYYMGSSSDFALYSEDADYSEPPASELESWKDTDTEISAQEQRKRDIAVYLTRESDFIEQCTYIYNIN